MTTATAKSTATSLRLTRIIGVDPETAFRAWTEPEQIRRWSFPEGYSVTESKIDLVIGGIYLLSMESADGQTHTARGTFREVDPPHRVVYTWHWDGEEHMGVETVVIVEFRAVEGGTEVVLEHAGFPTEEVTKDHLMGWTSCVDKYESIVG